MGIARGALSLETRKKRQKHAGLDTECQQVLQLLLAENLCKIQNLNSVAKPHLQF